MIKGVTNSLSLIINEYEIYNKILIFIQQEM